MMLTHNLRKSWIWQAAAVLSATAVQTAAAFGLNDLSRQLQSPQSVQGAFVQQRYLKSLDKPMTTSGQMVLLPKKALLWQMQKPFAQQLRVRGDGVWQLNGGTWQKLQGSSAVQQRQTAMFLELLGGDTRSLQNRFDVRLSGSAAQWQLTLLPKTAVTRQIFTQIDIRGDRVVREVRIQEKQGDKTVMRFDRVRIDAPLPAEAARALAY